MWDLLQNNQWINREEECREVSKGMDGIIVAIGQ